MDKGQGMVAVVRGLGDSQLAVTILDSGKQYTLLPNSALQPTPGQNECSSSTNTPCQQQLHQSQCNAAAQATDDRYASVYKMTHCKVRPTSPPIQLTEFPPQRSAVAPGHGNFEVGGTGSGDTRFSFVRANGSYRGGGMVWPDRGCVCSPRASREPDAFAESLRKYPSISPERSAEIVERLINYTQGKNFAKVTRQASASPTRLSAEQSDRSPVRGPSRCRACDFERTRYRCQGEYPTKDIPRKSERLDNDGESRRTFTKNYDVRYVKDMSKKLREGSKSSYMSPQCPSIREAFEIMNDNAATGQKPPHPGGHSMTSSGSPTVSVSPLMVNSQTQAAASTACKEVSTESRHQKFSRSVAVPLSPHPSDVSRPPEGAVFDPRPFLLQASVQTLFNPTTVTVRKSVQTTQSSIDISSVRSIKDTKKCRSDIEMTNKEVREEIICWLVDVLHTTYSKNLRADVIEKLKEKMKRVSKHFGGEEKKVKLKVESVDDDYSKDNLVEICDELVNKVKIKNRYYTQIYRAEVIPYRAPEDLKRAIKDWLLELPMRTRDYCGKYIDEEHMLTSFVKRLKKALFSPDYDTKKLRNEIVKILQDIPIDYGSSNQSVYLNRLANNLIKKITTANYYFNNNQKLKSVVENKAAQKKFRPNENEIRDLVRDEMIEFLDKFNIKISLERLQDVETDILGKIMEYLNNMRPNNNERFVDDVVSALQSIGAFEHQALYFANLIVDHLNELLTKAERSERDQARRLHMLTVLNSTVNETTDYDKRMTEGDMKNNLDSYVQQLTHQIDEWLAGLELQIPWSQDESFRQVVVNDLAEDIIDRLKYVELNRNASGTEKDELEYLKYLIFKWINKLVGEDHQETIEHAPELLERIRSVPVPSLAKSNTHCNSNLKSPDISPETSNQMATFGPDELENVSPLASGFSPSVGYSGSTNFQAFPVPIAGPSRVENPTTQTETGTVPRNMGMFLEGLRVPNQVTKNLHTLQRLNQMYDSFVRKWVQSVPIPAYTPEEAALAATMRVGLYNGIFQIISKLKFQPQLWFNPFYYQDALDEELEELLTLLPQTQEFQKQKHILKSLMIDKTTELNELIKIISAPDTFKDRIVNKYRDYVPRLSTSVSGECPIRLYEELQILNIAEDFILFTKYKEEDPLKAYMYRQILLERIRQFINEMKKFHGTELRDINPDVYMNEVMAALQQIPPPSQQDMKKEADEIFLGHAIDEWYMALPIAHNDNLFEQLKRRRLRDALTKKIQDMEKSLIAAGNTPEHELRHEISRFLEKIPLGKDESVNINFMVDALVNKVKNRVTPRTEVAELYNTTPNYSDFGENIALNSTTVQVPEGYRLVSPLPACCTAGLDRTFAQFDPSRLQDRIIFGLPADNVTFAQPGTQNLTQLGLTELERQASIVGGGPSLITTQSYNRHSANGLAQSPSSAVEGIETQGFAQQASEQQGIVIGPSRADMPQIPQDSASLTQKPVTELQPTTTDNGSNSEGQQNKFSDAPTPVLAGMAAAILQNFSDTNGNAQSRTAQSGQTASHKKPSIGESKNTQSLQVPGSSSVQRKPSMGEFGNSTQSQITHNQMSIKLSEDSVRHNGLGQRKCSGHTVQCSDKLCKTSSSYSKSKVCCCKKANAKKVTSDEGKQCSCEKTGDKKSIRVYSNSETMTKTKLCLCKGSKYCLCAVTNKRKSVVKTSIEGLAGSEAISNTNWELMEAKKKLGDKFTCEYSDVGLPGQCRHFQQHVLGTDFDYDRQTTEGSNTLISNHSLEHTHDLIQKQRNTQGDVQVDKKQRHNIVRGHVPGPTRRGSQDAKLPQQAAASQTSSAASPESDAGGGIAGDSETPAMGEQSGVAPEIEERARMLRPSLAQPGQSRNNHRVSIISPPSEERLRHLSEASTAAINVQQDPRVLNPILKDPGTYRGFEGAGALSSTLTEQNVGTYQAFTGGRPRSSSLNTQAVADPASTEQELRNVQPQVDISTPGRRISGAIFIQSPPIQAFNPTPQGGLIASLDNMASPQWFSLVQNDMPQSNDYQKARKPCVCPPYVSMLSPEQMSILSAQHTMPSPSQMFAPGFPPSQTFHQMIAPGQMNSQGMIFGPIAPLQGSPPSPGLIQTQLRQVPQSRMSELQRGRISQSRQARMSPSQQARMNQSQQSRESPLSYQDSRYTSYMSESPGAVGHDFSQDGRHKMHINEEERLVLLPTMPPELRTLPLDMERRRSMQNRTQSFGINVEPGVAQDIQEGQIRSMTEDTRRSMQAENVQNRSSTASMLTSLPRNLQTRSRQGSMQGIPQQSVDESVQRRGLQERVTQSAGDSVQRRESRGRRINQAIDEDVQQNVSVQTVSQQNAARQSLGQEAAMQNYQTEEFYIIGMGPSEEGMSQADRTPSQDAAEQSAALQSVGQEVAPQIQPVRTASQNATDQSSAWQTFPQQVDPQIAQEQDVVYQERTSQSQRLLSQASRRESQSVAEPVSVHYPSVSAGPGPVDRSPVSDPGSYIVYHPEEVPFQDMLIAGFRPGQSAQGVQDPGGYVQPAAFSTPQRPIPPNVPQRPIRIGRKGRSRTDSGSSGSDQRRRDCDARRRLELSDTDSDLGLRIRCRCYERLKRFRRRRNETHVDECDIPCPYAYYYYTCF